MAKSVGKHIPEIVLNPAAETPTEVLIIDDERDFLKMAKECLESRGNFRAETALSAKDAMRKLKKKNYEVIISDYVMPSKNGLEFLRDLRSSGNNVPFIIFTGKGREEVAIKALNLGASQYVNKNGDPETVYGQLAHSVRQVVQRKSAQDRLRASEERYRNLFEMAPDGIVTLDMKGVITSCNAAVMRLTGYYRDEVVGKHFSELGFLNSTDAPRYQALFASILRGEQPKPFEATWHNKNGTSHVSEFHVSLIKADDHAVGIQVIARNITDRKKVEDSLKESEEKYRTVVEESLQGIVVVKDFRIAFANKAVSKITGYTVDELLSFPPEKVKKVLFANDQALAWERLKERLTGKTVPKHNEYRIFRKDGTLCWLETFANKVDFEGKPAIQAAIIDITERKKAEELYNNVVELTPETIVNVNTEGMIVSCNTEAAKLIGLAQEELVGKHFSKIGILPAREIKKYHELFERSLRGEITEPLELRLHRKDRSPLFLEVRVGLLKEGSRIVGIQTVSRDITDRKITEQRIRESQQKFAQLFKDNPEATIFLDPDFRIDDVNPRFTKLFGYSLNEAKGKHTEDLIVPKDKVDEAEELYRNAKNGQVYLDTVRRAKGGNQIFVSVSAAPIGASEKLIGYVVIYRDITDRKKAEEELRESRRHFRKLFDLIVDPVGIVDKKGKILEVTDSVEKITGFKREDLVGKNFLRTKIATAKSKMILMKNLAKRMMGVHIPPYEVEILTKDGRKLPYEVNAAKIEYKGKAADLVVFRDVSQRKKMEEKLRVVGGLTRHDIRNKLSTITGNIYLAKKNLAGNNKTLDYLRDAESAIHQVARILDFARNYEKLGVEKLVPTDVGKAFEGAASLLSSLDDIEIVNSCLGLKILADSLLPQLFYNLIDNSLKHGQKVSQIKFYCEQTKNQLKLIYEDNGVGIPTTQKKLVFKEGWGRDTGYGLYLARKTCEVYGWSIEETGKSGRGVKFIITIANECSNR